MIRFAQSSLRQRLAYTLAFILFFVLFGYSLTKSVSFRADSETGQPLHIIGPILPPNFDGNGSGREIDIMQAALRAGAEFDNRPIRFHALPFGRHWAQYKRDQRYDAVLTVPEGVELGGYRSDVYIAYGNGILYLLEQFPDGLGPNPMTALTGKRVATFAGAADILPELNEQSDRFSLYTEREYQYSHSGMLMTGFVDAVIADPMVTAHYLGVVASRIDKKDSTEIGFVPYYCPTDYRITFRDETLRRQFDNGLKIIKDNGTLTAINRRYDEYDDRFVTVESTPDRPQWVPDRDCSA